MGMMQDVLGGARAIIFDCDGTLVDSSPLYAQAWAVGLATSGKIMAPQWYLPRNGLSESVLMDNFEQDHNVILDRKRVIETLRATYLSNLPLLAEIENVCALARIACGIIPTAVASGGSAEIVLASLRQTGLIDMFAAVTTYDDVPVPKPAPDLFLHAAERFNVAPQDCIAIEDSATGLAAARAAGMRVIDIQDVESLFDLDSRLRKIRTWRGLS